MFAEVAPVPTHTTTGTRLEYANLEGWLECWRELQGRRWRRARIEGERNHLAELPDAVIRACDSCEVLEEVRAIAKAYQGDRWHRRTGPGGETPSAIVAMRTHNQAERIRRTVPDFGAMALELEAVRVGARELVTVGAHPSPSVSKSMSAGSSGSSVNTNHTRAAKSSRRQQGSGSAGVMPWIVGTGAPASDKPAQEVFTPCEQEQEKTCS